MSDPTRKRIRLHPKQTLTIVLTRENWALAADVKRLLDPLNQLIKGRIEIEDTRK